MIRRACRYLWKERHAVVKYGIVGISSVVLDMSLLIFFTESFGITPVLAVVTSQVLVFGYNFSLNKYWSFRSADHPRKQLIRYVSLAAANYVFAVLSMYVFHQVLNIDYRIVRIASIALMVSWNFLLYKHWVYKDECDEDPVHN